MLKKLRCSGFVVFNLNNFQNRSDSSFSLLIIIYEILSNFSHHPEKYLGKADGEEGKKENSTPNENKNKMRKMCDCEPVECKRHDVCSGKNGCTKVTLTSSSDVHTSEGYNTMYYESNHITLKNETLNAVRFAYAVL